MPVCWSHSSGWLILDTSADDSQEIQGQGPDFPQSHLIDDGTALCYPSIREILHIRHFLPPVPVAQSQASLDIGKRQGTDHFPHSGGRRRGCGIRPSHTWGRGEGH